MNAPCEVFFLLGADGEILFRDEGESAVFIPDSRGRWEAIWEERERLTEVAHSHPLGPLAFSREDETTMQALVTALARPIVFSVVTKDAMIRRRVDPTGSTTGPDERVADEPSWASELRKASGL